MFQIAGPNFLNQRHLRLLGLGLLLLRLEHIHGLGRRKVLHILNILHRLKRLHGQRQKIGEIGHTSGSPHALLCLLALALALVTINGRQKWIDLAWRWVPDQVSNQASNQITHLVRNMLRLLLLLLLLDVLAEKLLSLLLELLLLLELKLGHLGRQAKLLKQL